MRNSLKKQQKNSYFSFFKLKKLFKKARKVILIFIKIDVFWDIFKIW